MSLQLSLSGSPVLGLGSLVSPSDGYSGNFVIVGIPAVTSPLPTPEPTPEPEPSAPPSSASEPTPTPTVTVTETASPAPTVTVTQTVEPSGPSEVTLQGEQFSALTVGLVLIVTLLAALFSSQMRRP